MGALANRLESQNVAAGEEPCRLCVKLGELSTEDATAIRTAMTRGISTQDLYHALRDEGHRVVRDDIWRHRREGHL